MEKKSTPLFLFTHVSILTQFSGSPSSTVPTKSELKKARTHATPPSSPSLCVPDTPVVPTSPDAYASLDSPAVAKQTYVPNPACPIPPSPLISTASSVLPISPVYYHLDSHQPAQSALFPFKCMSKHEQAG